MSSHERLIDAVEDDTFSRLIGLSWEVAEERNVPVRTKLRPEHINSVGRVHGGLLYAMADTGMGLTPATVLAPSARVTTVSATVLYLEPAVGEELVAESTLLHKGRRIASLRCEIRDEAGTLCAVAMGNYYVSEPTGEGPADRCLREER
ncbi:MAG: PaaI family thioesterase [Thermoanaerobaculia bacterium]